jgi:UDP-glucuronate 4-epimerase
MRVLVTGCAGFIGSFCCQRLIDRGDSVIGVDNLNDYYDVALKKSRLALLTSRPGFRFSAIDVVDTAALLALFATERIDAVLHLAAQAGVRYSLKNPLVYAHTNLIGFTNILEGCRLHDIRHLVYASTSSVYGANRKLPFSEHDAVDHPVSFYAATKKSNELMAHAYSHLFGIPTTGLRFFTVYGPWGRPDMSPMLFASAILEGRAIEIFNHGAMARDFTYIDDIVEGVLRVVDRPASPDPNYDPALPDPATSSAPYRLYNIGNQGAVNLLEYIETLEDVLGKKAEKVFLPMQPGDVPETFADVSLLQQQFGFIPATPLRNGLEKFAAWFTSYHCTQS